MLTRNGKTVPFVEEERKERILTPPKIETRASSLIPLIDERRNLVAAFDHVLQSVSLSVYTIARPFI